MFEPPEGTLLRRGDGGYEAARCDAVWNARKPARYPDQIVVARSSDDVVWAVRAAAAASMRIGIRSGGHSWYGNGVRDGGMLIDVSGLADIELDHTAMTAAVGPGTTGRALDAALVDRDLFFPVGHCGSVGLGGFALGGGYGWNSRALGPACLSIRAIEVVLADGSLVHADDESHPDLMWAARGAGPGFFGVVTRLHFALCRRPRMVRAGHIYPLSAHDQVLEWALEVLPSLPAELEASVRVGYSPLAGETCLALTGMAFADSDSDQDAEALLALLDSCPVVHRALKRFATPVAGLPDLHDRGVDGPPIRWDVDGIWTDAAAAEIIPAAGRMVRGIPSPDSFVLWMLWGGHPQRPDACWSMQAPLYVSPNAGWHSPAEDAAHEHWVDESLRQLGPHSRGVQFSDANLSARAGRGLSDENARRLEEIRSKYDPAALFHSYMVPA